MNYALRRGLEHADRVALGDNLLTTCDVKLRADSMIPAIGMETNMEQDTRLDAIFDPVKPGSSPGRLFQGQHRSTPGASAPSGCPATRILRNNRAMRFSRAQAYGILAERPSGTGIRRDREIARQEIRGDPELVRLLAL
jgi:urease subunit gamma/beta